MGDKPKDWSSTIAILNHVHTFQTPWGDVPIKALKMHIADKIRPMVSKARPNPSNPYDMRFKATREGMKALNAVYEALEADWVRSPKQQARDYSEILRGVV